MSDAATATETPPKASNQSTTPVKVGASDQDHVAVRTSDADVSNNTGTETNDTSAELATEAAVVSEAQVPYLERTGGEAVVDIATVEQVVVTAAVDLVGVAEPGEPQTSETAEARLPSLSFIGANLYDTDAISADTLVAPLAPSLTAADASDIQQFFTPASSDYAWYDANYTPYYSSFAVALAAHGTQGFTRDITGKLTYTNRFSYDVAVEYADALDERRWALRLSPTSVFVVVRPGQTVVIPGSYARAQGPRALASLDMNMFPVGYAEPGNPRNEDIENAWEGFTFWTGFIPGVGTFFNGISIVLDVGQAADAWNRKDADDFADEIGDVTSDLIGLIPAGKQLSKTNQVLDDAVKNISGGIADWFIDTWW